MDEEEGEEDGGWTRSQADNDAKLCDRVNGETLSTKR